MNGCALHLLVQPPAQPPPNPTSHYRFEKHSRGVSLQALKITEEGRACTEQEQGEDALPNTRLHICPSKFIQQLSSPWEPTHVLASESATSASTLTQSPPSNASHSPSYTSLPLPTVTSRHPQPCSLQQSKPWGTQQHQAAASPASARSRQPPLLSQPTGPCHSSPWGTQTLGAWPPAPSHP